MMNEKDVTPKLLPKTCPYLPLAANVQLIKTLILKILIEQSLAAQKPISLSPREDDKILTAKI